VVTEEWLEFKLRRGEELARRAVVTPTPSLSSAARQVAAIKGAAAGKRFQQPLHCDGEQA
jgi:hypothetical protein